MPFKANVILKQTHGVCPISGGVKCVNGKVKMKKGGNWCTVVKSALLTSAGGMGEKHLTLMPP